MHQLSTQHLQALLDQHMRSTLNQYEHQRLVSTQPLSTDDVENGNLVWDYLAKDTQDQLARNDYGRVKLSTDELLEENAIQLDPSSIEYRRVCRELLKSEARLIHIEQQRTQGKYDQPLESEGVSQALPAIYPTRIVPIHKTLLELGLLEFVACQKKKGATRLFPELHKGRDGYSQIPSKWFGRFMDRTWHFGSGQGIPQLQAYRGGLFQAASGAG